MRLICTFTTLYFTLAFYSFKFFEHSDLPLFVPFVTNDRVFFLNLSIRLSKSQFCLSVFQFSPATSCKIHFSLMLPSIQTLFYLITSEIHFFCLIVSSFLLFTRLILFINTYLLAGCTFLFSLTSSIFSFFYTFEKNL